MTALYKLEISILGTRFWKKNRHPIVKTENLVDVKDRPRADQVGRERQNGVLEVGRIRSQFMAAWCLLFTELVLSWETSRPKSRTLGCSWTFRNLSFAQIPWEFHITDLEIGYHDSSEATYARRAHGTVEKETAPEFYKISNSAFSPTFGKFSKLHLTEIQWVEGSLAYGAENGSQDISDRVDHSMGRDSECDEKVTEWDHTGNTSPMSPFCLSARRSEENAFGRGFSWGTLTLQSESTLT